MIYSIFLFIGAVTCTSERVFSSSFIQVHYPPIELEKLIVQERRHIFPLTKTKDCGICFLKPGNEWDRLIGNAGLEEAIKENIVDHFETVEKFFFPTFTKNGILIPEHSLVIATKVLGEPVTQLMHAEVKYLLKIAEISGLGVIESRDLIRSCIDDEKIYIVNTQYERFMHNNPVNAVAKMLLSSQIHLHSVTRTYLENVTFDLKNK